LVLAAIVWLTTPVAAAAEIHVGVATNFADTARTVAAAWTRSTGHRVVFSIGSTGQLFAQIRQGAPLDVFLSADEASARRAEDEGLAVPGSRFTYAIGRLVVFSVERGRVRDAETLRSGQFERLALASPSAAPYGAAAMDVIRRLGLEERLRRKIVFGQSIAQTYQFVRTGNADLGFVALSQVVGHAEGSRWLVPENLHSAIRQDAVLLRRADNDTAARDFLVFLRGPEGRRIVETFGYGRDP